MRMPLPTRFTNARERFPMLPEKKKGRVVAGIVNPPLLDFVPKLHNLGFTDTEIVREGVRSLAKREKVTV